MSSPGNEDPARQHPSPTARALVKGETPAVDAARADGSGLVETMWSFSLDGESGKDAQLEELQRRLLEVTMRLKQADKRADEADRRASEAEEGRKEERRQKEEERRQKEEEQRQKEEERRQKEEEQRQKEEERRQKEEERRQKEEERRQKEELLRASAAGRILQQGFPPLGANIMSHNPSSSRAAHMPFQVFPRVKEFGVLNCCRISNLKRRPSIVWQKTASRDWTDEADIRERASNAVFDCITATGLEKRTYVYPEICFASVKKHKDRTDLAISTTGPLSTIVGAIEVKRPGFDLGDIGQVVNYMHELRAFYNMRFVFSALTTYAKWKFLWFEDSDDAAQETDATKFKDVLCLHSPTLRKGIPQQLKIYQSRIFDYNDLGLIETLSSFLFKAAYTPSDWSVDDESRSQFLAKNRQFQKVTIDKDKYLFRKLPTAENLAGTKTKATLKEFSYAFLPDGRTKVYYFLRVYHRTGDGRVALSTTASGRIAVFKFFNDGYEIFDKSVMDREATEEEKEKALQMNENKAKGEAELWKQLWGVRVPVRFLLKQYAIVMPFVFHARIYPSRVRFCPLESWNFRGNDRGDFLSKDIVEDAFIDKEGIKGYMEDPMKAAKEALHRMVMECGYRHDDLKWSHVGLLPVKVTDSKWTVKPVLLDLCRVSKLGDGIEERRKCYDDQVRILEEELAKINSRTWAPAAESEEESQ